MLVLPGAFVEVVFVIGHGGHLVFVFIVTGHVGGRGDWGFSIIVSIKFFYF